ncbi:MAG: molybdenum cofactor biosynthesis protein MoaE [Propionibacteriaceae bacterium]|jgi:molybdopterin synthase catalytic subunit|nr:molybdenum cofactor biosynthesis protein MoaE [Propionibacteriaceae bacterium]
MTQVVQAHVGPDPLNPAAMEAMVRDKAAGACVAFVGIVRDHDCDRAVVALEYEAHPSASDVLRQLLDDHGHKHPEVIKVAAAHRTGALTIGDVAFVACVSAAHRRDAFLACAEIVDTVKEKLPVWKLQRFADNSCEWVNAS